MTDVESALAEKDLGNEAYKKKEFDVAHEHYDKAIKLNPSNIVFYNNKAAVFFEEERFDECIEMCKQAVEVGRDNRADYQMIARAMARIGNAYLKKENQKEALHWFQKSLSEHRDQELVKKTKALENEIKEAEKRSYINPKIAEEEKQKGNDYFKKGDFPNAMKHYNEAVKRDPENAVLYSNRAACYTKLMDFQRALEDCDTCIRKDKKFVKGYIRKGACLMAMKEFSRAQDAYKGALAVDPSNAEAMQGLRQAYSSSDEPPEKARERALNDPEVQEILSDPGMRLILEQMSQDPGAIRAHLSNPEIAKKIHKLKNAGIIQMR
ncbi:unnamed protein product, partial [Mesorhabditis belari]|uniref:Stress-induced-phosphoprotein 1 n=1 Tax=Mesorhabditis belari TaxID=2138241 RepID=A0AAF3ESH7_9BILA